MITLEQLKTLLPRLPDAKAEEFYPCITAGMIEFEITTLLRQSCYLAMLFEESAGLTHFEENLNYSASRLCQVWPRRFPNIRMATPYAHNPEKLANYVYANRLGNGAPESGDGWRFKGTGPIQVTGRDMFEKIAAALGIDCVEHPELLLEPADGFKSAAWLFAVEKGCNPIADRADIYGVTRRINGGLNGIAERIAYFKHARSLLA